VRKLLVSVGLVGLIVVAGGGCTVDHGIPRGFVGGVGADINENGVITGWGPTIYGIRGFIKRPGQDYVNLGQIRDTSTLPEAINNAEQVVGALWENVYGTTFHRPFRWEASTGLIEMPGFGGPNGEATDINDAGTIVGWSTLPTVNGQLGPKQAWYWNPGDTALTPLPSLAGNPPSYAAGINELGDIVGWVYEGDTPHAVLWERDTHLIVDIGPAGIASEAHDINDAGVASGLQRPNPYASHAVRWLAGTHAVDDLGTLGGSFGCGNVINADGVIVGSDLTVDKVRHAFRWDPNTRAMTDLGTIDNGGASHAAGLNNKGSAVGWANDAQGHQHVIEWTP
jgi:probable HAF family extracellular repeat protein